MVANLKRQKKRKHKCSNHCPLRCWQSNKMADQDFYSSQKRDSTSFPPIHPAIGVRKILGGKKMCLKGNFENGREAGGGGGDTIFKTSGVNSRRIEFFRLIQFKRGWLGRPRSSQWDGIAGKFSKIRNRDFHQISFSSQNWGPELGYFDVWDFLLAFLYWTQGNIKSKLWNQTLQKAQRTRELSSSSSKVLLNLKCGW